MAPWLIILLPFLLELFGSGECQRGRSKKKRRKSLRKPGLAEWWGIYSVLKKRSEFTGRKLIKRTHEAFATLKAATGTEIDEFMAQAEAAQATTED